MSLIWPQALLLLAAIPVGVWAYRAIGRRRLRRLEILGGLGLDGEARRRQSLPSRIAPVLFVLGLGVLTIAMARPEGTLDLPRQEGTVILAFDVSGSMAATDLSPTRIAAAKAAATDFVQRQPQGVAIGVVAFSDSGVSVQVPTTDQGAVLGAIARLTPQRGTSLGQGILASLAAVATAEAVPSVDYYSNRSPAPSPSPPPVPPGSHGSAVIILLTDGENNESPDPTRAAQAAADQGIRIDTVGIGSQAGTTLDINGFRVHTQLDADLLRQVAQLTDGTYYGAESAAQLRAVYASLDPRLVVKPQTIELTAFVAAAGLLFLVVGVAASLAWLGRAP